MQLFEHDQTAYDAAITMLAKTGRAEIIRPVGTERAFIGLKLCENAPEKRVLWLTASEAVYKRQLERWTASGGAPPENIVLLTYDSLMWLTDAALKALSPDIAVMDGASRAEAAHWQSGIQRLCRLYPDVPVLRLSNGSSRDDRHGTAGRTDTVVSEMTLGEAIVRGILDLPRYIFTIHPHQKTLERYEKRVSAVKREDAREAAAAELETLRRTFADADSLGTVLERHMTDRHGRYLLCTDRGSMQAYMDKAGEWFGGLDANMHLYAVCSDAPAADPAFQAFAADKSDHLRLLYCTAALDETVCLADISGVILLRTDAPSIDYEASVGWALAAARPRVPLIVDIVDSSEHLYSLYALKDEMCRAIDGLRAHGRARAIVNTTLEVIDEPAGCRASLEQLERTLAPPWDSMYDTAVHYYQRYGDLDPPKRWTSAEGEPLWRWLHMMRRIRAGGCPGSLTDAEIEKLDRIGMHWDISKDVVWDRYYAAARAYYEDHHSLQPLTTYVTPDGVPLGAWLARLRTARQVGLNSSYLTPEHIAQLDAIGMAWDVHDLVFERNYHAAQAYYREHGDLECGPDHVDDQGIRLGAWLRYLRQQYKTHGRAILTKEQFALLDAIGMRWGSKYDKQWDDRFERLAAYIQRTGNKEIAVTYKEGALQLGRWFRRQQELYNDGQLRPDRVEKLLALGLDLTEEDPWEVRFRLAKAYSEAHGGSLNVPHDHIVDGVWLNKWLSEQRLMGEGKRKKRLTPEQEEKLRSIGMVFGQSYAEQAWETHYLAVRAYIEQNGTTDIPKGVRDGSADLRLWLNRQVAYARDGKLSEDAAAKLRALGIALGDDDPFEIGLAHAKEYHQEHGDLHVKKGHRCSDGFDLAAWIAKTRKKKKKGKLTDAQIKRAEAVGMVWDVMSDAWEEMFEAAKAFAVADGPLHIPVHCRAANGRDLYDWYMRQRSLYKAGKLLAERAQKLLSIGADLMSGIRQQTGQLDTEAYFRKNA